MFSPAPSPQEPELFSRAAPVLARLFRGRLDHCVFGSAAGEVYGLRRPPADVDILVRCGSMDELMACLPQARRISENGLCTFGVEIWRSPLILRFAGREALFP